LKISEDQITTVNATQLLEQGVAAIRGGDAVVDLSQVARVDSSAVALLLAFKREAVERNIALQFQAMPKALASLASLYGVDTLLT